jgi:hypothetical protein
MCMCTLNKGKRKKKDNWKEGEALGTHISLLYVKERLVKSKRPVMFVEIDTSSRLFFIFIATEIDLVCL